MQKKIRAMQKAGNACEVLIWKKCRRRAQTERALPTREASNGKNQNVHRQAYRHFYLAAPFFSVFYLLIQRGACGLKRRFVRS